ncbi:MAG: DUF188 domain-containing protein, partial [Rhizobiales bacterium]|nr:DUF188 domain-containing protein [Hyphomicrobiales bacterium]
MIQPSIFVDADACPVKDEIVKVAERHGLAVTFVANSGLRPSRDPMIRNVVVSAGFDNAILSFSAANTDKGPRGYTTVFGKTFDTTGVLGLSGKGDDLGP